MPVGTRTDPYRVYNFRVEIDGITRAGFRECSGLDTSNDAQLWEWRQKAMDGAVERKNGSIVLMDETGAEKLRWNFREAWPTKWTGPSLNATGSEVAIETLELAHEGLVKA